MALFKCKMCGGSLDITNNETVFDCEYCGSRQTLPRLDDEKKVSLYDRANHFRRNNDYDKAMGIYEQILNEDSSDAEAYWSLVLCKYGIEYVEDPTSHKRIPTVNRAQYTSIYDDVNYKSALDHADSLQKAVYEEEAKYINEIQKGILEISQNEEPFDVFICYKETDENGRRTQDSVLANDLYHQLTQEGLKVFFARITLEDKIGTAYEPYIFAALNSAKAMVVIGTKQEYFNAVWVKNEWSRYLALIKQGQKKILIPAYRDMDPYNLPDEFSHLQAQDMGKLGFMQDLIRGIKKITGVDEPKPTVIREVVAATPAGANVANLVKRMYLELEDGNWDKAQDKIEDILDMEPECADAYIGRLLISKEAENLEELTDDCDNYDKDVNYNKAIRFASDELRKELIFINAKVTKNIGTKEGFARALELLKEVSGWKNADSIAAEIVAEVERISTVEKKLEEINDKLCKTKDGYMDQDDIKDEINNLNKKLNDLKHLHGELPELLVRINNTENYIKELNDTLSKIKYEREHTIFVTKKKVGEWQFYENKCENEMPKVKSLLGRLKKESMNYTNLGTVEKNIEDTQQLIKYKEYLLSLVVEYDETEAQLYELWYNEAVYLYNNEKYKDAKDLFEVIEGYKDSEEYLELVEWKLGGTSSKNTSNTKHFNNNTSYNNTSYESYDFNDSDNYDESDDYDESDEIWDVELISAGDSKVTVIKIVREFTGLGLKEAKDLVDSAPCIVAEGLTEEEAFDFEEMLTDAGATAIAK